MIRHELKTALVLGGGGFIGGHLARRLKDEGFWVRVVDIKTSHEFFTNDEICHEYIEGDLRDPQVLQQYVYFCRKLTGLHLLIFSLNDNNKIYNYHD